MGIKQIPVIKKEPTLFPLTQGAAVGVDWFAVAIEVGVALVPFVPIDVPLLNTGCEYTNDIKNKNSTARISYKR